jgi:Fe-S-cluster containining protein
MVKVITTFPSTLRYKCDIDACPGCCSLFDEISISREEVEALERLGYASFYMGKGEKLLLENPCTFSRGKLCEIHLKHGYAAKPEACKKYPFTVSMLDNGWMMVDIKWACPGVGVDKGDLLTAEYIEKELLSFIDLNRINSISVGDFVPLSDGSKTKISRSGVKELYDYASERILFSGLELRGKITGLTSLITQFSQACAGSETVTLKRISEILRTLKLEALEPGIDLNDQELSYYGLIDELLGFELNPVMAGKKLGLEYRLASPRDAGFTKDAGELYSLYLSQSLKETLSKPWSMRASFFWVLGVMGYVDFVSRSMAKEEVEKEEMRAAIAVVDFLNKGFEEFRNYAYPRYPELGLSYLGLLLGN